MFSHVPYLDLQKVPCENLLPILRKTDIGYARYDLGEKILLFYTLLLLELDGRVIADARLSHVSDLDDPFGSRVEENVVVDWVELGAGDHLSQVF